MVGASHDSVSMVEGEFDEISEEEMTDAIKFGHEAIKNQIQAQTELVNKVGKKETREYDSGLDDEDLLKNIHENVTRIVMKLQKKALTKKKDLKIFQL